MKNKYTLLEERCEYYSRVMKDVFGDNVGNFGIETQTPPEDIFHEMEVDFEDGDVILYYDFDDEGISGSLTEVYDAAISDFMHRLTIGWETINDVDGSGNGLTYGALWLRPKR